MPIGDSLFRKNVTRSDGYAWLGLDFGTATTECVIRIERAGQKDQIAVLAFGGTNRADAGVVLPSAMEMSGDRLLPSYALTGRGKVIEVLKTELIAEIEDKPYSTGLRRLDSPYYFAILHLASVIAVARTAVRGWVTGFDLKYYLNISAPVGADSTHPRNARVREVFREVAYRALLLSSWWPQQSPTLTQAAALYEQVMREPMPGPGDSPVTAVPEALAAVTSFLHRPDLVPGNFATVDIGGGTTDISYFWLQTGQYDVNHERKAWYYAVRSSPVGTNDILKGVRHGLDATEACTAHQRLLRVAQEGGLSQECVTGFLHMVDAAYRDTYRDAFGVRPIQREWCVDGKAMWTLLLLGGGCGFEFAEQHLRDTPPRNLNISEHGPVRPLSAPASLNIVSPSGVLLRPSPTRSVRGGGNVLRSSGHLLTVAHGLSFRVPDIPKYGVESPIEPPPPPKPWEPPAHTVHN
ncbi:MAG: hypothetical protein KF817_03625 [Phycisphaeraceae bacterium]|nr:hypothetical protein [Phycisphaeraceae bacterium]